MHPLCHVQNMIATLLPLRFPFFSSILGTEKQKLDLLVEGHQRHPLAPLTIMGPSGFRYGVRHFNVIFFRLFVGTL